MATPFDVVSKHRLQAWMFFALIMGGFLALCIGTTVWHAHQRNHPPVAMKYLDDPVQLGDVSICLTNEWGYFPVNLTGIQASCEVGPAFQVPAVQQINSTVSLASRPSQLSKMPIFQSGVTSFQANEAGCSISQSFRSDVLGSVPKNCFRFATHSINFQANTSVILALAFQSISFTNSENPSAPAFSGPAGSQALLALFTDGLNSLSSFEVAYQALNSSNNVQLQPSVQTNIKAYANGNHTQTFANPTTTVFGYGSLPGAFLGPSTSYVQMVITTTPKGYLSIQEQDPLSALVLLPAYGGFWPYFIVAFGILFTGEPNLGIRPFIVRFFSAIWRKVRPVKTEREKSSTLPMNLSVDSAAAGHAMSEAEKKERAFMANHHNRV